MSSTNPLPVGGSAPIFLTPFSPVWMSAQNQVELPNVVVQMNQALSASRTMMNANYSAGGGKGTRSPIQASALRWGLSRGFVVWDPGGAT